MFIFIYIIKLYYISWIISQLDLSSLMPLSVAGCGRLQLKVLHSVLQFNN